MTVMNRHRVSFADAVHVAHALRPSYPVYCLRPHVLQRAAAEFVARFPGRTLYAVKCNPHPRVLKALYEGGIRAFDTASLAEIAQVCETWADVGAYFMHPVKSRPAIGTAQRVYGVRVFAVDHIDELHKLAAETGGVPGVVAVWRFRTEKSGSLCHLAEKFGAEPADAAALLREVVRLGLKPGLAFHVGSQCRAPAAYREALHRAGEIIRAAGVAPVCLDVGGGFPVRYNGAAVPPLADFMRAITDGLAALDLPQDCEIVAEPGRVLTAEGCSLLAQVQLRRGDRLYINDGVYGSLSEVVAADLKLPARAIRLNGTVAGAPRTFTLAGPTCDSLDLLANACVLPDGIGEGDWIEIDRIGAYSNAVATRFNGFHPETFVDVGDEPPGEGAC
jgi:ornithine decarboxylase